MLENFVSRITLHKKCPYSELSCSAFFPHLPALGRMRENVGKMWTRITPNTDIFYASKIDQIRSVQCRVNWTRYNTNRKGVLNFEGQWYVMPCFSVTCRFSLISYFTTISTTIIVFLKKDNVNFFDSVKVTISLPEKEAMSKDCVLLDNEVYLQKSVS